jgi:hypothetical protein
MSVCGPGITRAGQNSAHTLGVHEVGDGDRVVALDVGNHAVEDSIGMGLPRAEAHVLLAELLELRVDGDGLLHATKCQ